MIPLDHGVERTVAIPAPTNPAPADADLVVANARHGLSCRRSTTGYGCTDANGRAVVPFFHLDPIKFTEFGFALVTAPDNTRYYVDTKYDQQSLTFGVDTDENKRFGLQCFAKRAGRICSDPDGSSREHSFLGLLDDEGLPLEKGLREASLCGNGELYGCNDARSGSLRPRVPYPFQAFRLRYGARGVSHRQTARWMVLRRLGIPPEVRGDRRRGRSRWLDPE
jgi:hypothetical protein